MSDKRNPTLLDMDALLVNVPEEDKSYVKKTSTAIMMHPAYGKPYEWSTDDFDLGASLGRGKVGRVYIAREKKTHFMVAMKIMFKSEIRKGRIEKQVLREIEIQSHLKHPNILRLYTWFHDHKRIYIALELASQGEVFKHLQACGRFPEPRAAKYTYQVADALNYCHINQVIHRDLKPENLMLTCDDNIKLADFGWSIHSVSNKRKTMCGTLDYLPPEMVDGRSYDNSVDQWCLGILCYEFLVGKPPFEAEDNQNTYAKIRKTEVIFPYYLSPGAINLISKLLQKNQKLRISLVEVMQHSWIKKFYQK